MTTSQSSSNLDRSGGPATLPTATIPPVHDGIYRVAALDRYPELLHGISTRLSPTGDDWNLSARRGTPEHPPSWERALSNREGLARRLGIPLDRMVGCQQVHGSAVAVVDVGDAGRGMSPDLPSVEGADAMVTATPGLYLLALSADCPPVFFYDPVRRVAGLAHSGWKGTVARIAYNVVEALVDNFGSEPADIVAVVGPGIGPCCYEVGPNVVEAVEAAFLGAWSLPNPLLETRNGSTYFNLWEAIRRALLDAGLRPANITVEAVCTAHNLDVFYSHRAEHAQCGLFGAVIGMRET
jgi:YfiH family protein